MGNSGKLERAGTVGRHGREEKPVFLGPVSPAFLRSSAERTTGVAAGWSIASGSRVPVDI